MRACFLAILLTTISTARADDTLPLPAKKTVARHHLLYHDVALAGGTTVYILSETVLKSRLAPEVCRWCSTPSIDIDVRNSLKWHDTQLADQMSAITAYVIAPLVPSAIVIGTSWHDVGFTDAVDDGLAIGEAGIATALIGQAIKLSVGRQRPFVAFGEPGRVYDPDDDVSFFSGHTSFAFAVAAASGTIASEHHYRTAPIVWGVGMTAAAATGYFRIAADKHYFTDVTIGAVVGTGMGLLFPRLFHGHGRIHVIPAPTENGLALVGSF
ncbi:MAG TPA: phosphatase PAP2 family protein [Kofleriaceae bacterium]|jgi:membrane-associated phospholipid phosphatase|nr:phosphatase PAP2 family protein [Kofleriaceae bacterium]